MKSYAEVNGRDKTKLQHKPTKEASKTVGAAKTDNIDASSKYMDLLKQAPSRESMNILIKDISQ